MAEPFGFGENKFSFFCSLNLLIYISLLVDEFLSNLAYFQSFLAFFFFFTLPPTSVFHLYLYDISYIFCSLLDPYIWLRRCFYAIFYSLFATTTPLQYLFAMKAFERINLLEIIWKRQLKSKLKSRSKRSLWTFIRILFRFTTSIRIRRKIRQAL